jgi:hypothetical protein
MLGRGVPRRLRLAWPFHDFTEDNFSLGVHRLGDRVRLRRQEDHVLQMVHPDEKR